MRMWLRSRQQNTLHSNSFHDPRRDSRHPSQRSRTVRFGTRTGKHLLTLFAGAEVGLKKIPVVPPPRSAAKACPDPVRAVFESQLPILDPNGARTRMFSPKNPERAKVGDIIPVRLKTGEPFSGVLLSIRQRHSDSTCERKRRRRTDQAQADSPLVPCHEKKKLPRPSPFSSLYVTSSRATEFLAPEAAASNPEGALCFDQNYNSLVCFRQAGGGQAFISTGLGFLSRKNPSLSLIESLFLAMYDDSFLLCYIKEGEAL